MKSPFFVHSTAHVDFNVDATNVFAVPSACGRVVFRTKQENINFTWATGYVHTYILHTHIFSFAEQPLCWNEMKIKKEKRIRVGEYGWIINACITNKNIPLPSLNCCNFWEIFTPFLLVISSIIIYIHTHTHCIS